MSCGIVIRVMAVSWLLGACGCGVTTPGGSTGGDAGPAAQADAGHETGLQINASLGLTINPLPVNDESALSGMVMLKNDGEDAPASSVITVNGKALRPVDLFPGFWEANPADAPVIGSDRKLTIAASVAGNSASISCECPEELAMTTSPAAGSALAEGDQVAVSWSRELFVNDLGLFYSPTLEIRGYDPTAKSAGFDSKQAKLVKGTSSSSVAAPETDLSGYLLNLDFPGLLKVENGNAVICYRSNRVVFSKK